MMYSYGQAKIVTVMYGTVTLQSHFVRMQQNETRFVVSLAFAIFYFKHSLRD